MQSRLHRSLHPENSFNESANQFGREYKRLLDEPPRKSVLNIKTGRHWLLAAGFVPVATFINHSTVSPVSVTLRKWLLLADSSLWRTAKIDPKRPLTDHPRAGHAHTRSIASFTP